MPHSPIGFYSRLVLSGLLLTAAGACGDSPPLAPTAVTIPSPAPPPAPAAVPTHPIPGLTGVYDFSCAVDRFDPVWGDLTGYRFTGVLTLEDGAGALSELRGFDAAGEPGPAPPGGRVMPIVQVGLPVLKVEDQLVSFVVESLDAPAAGQTSSPRFAGRFGTGNPNGPFVAVRRSSASNPAWPKVR